MKQTSILFSLLMAIYVHPIIAAPPFTEGEVVNVFAPSGLNLRAFPKIDAEVLDIVRYGDRVVVENTFDFAADKADRIDYIDGHWILVNYQGIKGYLFDGYLSSLPFPSTEDQLVDEGFSFAYTLGEYLDHHFDFVETLDSTFNTQRYLLSQGIKIRRIVKENSFRLTIEMPNTKPSEILNVMRSMFTDRAQRSQFDRSLLFIENDHGTITEIKTTEAQDQITIKINKNGTLIISADGQIGC